MKKIWHIKEGSLGFYEGALFILPSAEKIYSAVFEKKYSSEVNEDDVESLKKTLRFYKYPIDLIIVLRNNALRFFSIELLFCAITNDHDFQTLSSQYQADHIIIKDTWYPFPVGRIEELKQTLDKAGIRGFGEIKLGQYLTLLKLDSDLIRNEVTPSTVYNENIVSIEKPLKLKADLYPYQQKGWEWLRFMRNEKIGGILADEMGLGKTIQIISLCCSEFNDIFPTLIISPATLLENWNREFRKFAPHIETLVHQGPYRTGFPTEIKKSNVIITSYETAIRDSSLFGQIFWKMVVCDEAQAIKNPQTKRAITIKKIAKEIGFAVTGTPVENKLMDLWSILDFSTPGFLNSQTSFEENFGHSVSNASELEKIVSPLILRRKVIEVAKDLPNKIIIPQILELNALESSIYEAVRSETISEFKSNSTLAVLTRLRMFCTHPFLIDDSVSGDLVHYSNKYRRLVEIIDEIVSNEAKLIIFTSFTKMIDLIVSDIKVRFGIYTNSIDGRTVINERQNIVDEFSSISGSALLALNPTAAGTGLNITAANHVIHYNLEWNPAKEDQASARSYRRGQDRPVTIHRLFYANTVEEAIDERLDRKRILAGTAIVGVKGDEEDLNDILIAINKSPKANAK